MRIKTRTNNERVEVAAAAVDWRLACWMTELNKWMNEWWYKLKLIATANAVYKHVQ